MGSQMIVLQKQVLPDSAVVKTTHRSCDRHDKHVRLHPCVQPAPWLLEHDGCQRYEPRYPSSTPFPPLF